MTSPPLAGLFVLDLSRVLAGPWATQLLASLGARVVKVEAPGGDPTRGWGPPFAPDGTASYFRAVNRGKESIVLDLKSEGDRATARALAARADVLVENFGPGGMERHGLALEALEAANPRLVIASISGFGPDGPDRDAPGFDLLAQAGAGLMAITGEPDGPPQKVGVAVSDVVTGTNAALGILSLLAARDRTGRGGRVDVDLFSSTLALLCNVVQASLVTGAEAGRHGTAHPQIVPYQAFEAADGSFALAVGTDAQFARLCDRVVARPEWAADPRFSTNAARVLNRSALVPALEEIFRCRPVSSWLEACRAAEVPAGPVRGPLQAARSPQARALGLVVLDEDGVPGVTAPVRLPGGAAPVHLRQAPRLDEDGARLRAELGLP